MATCKDCLHNDVCHFTFPRFELDENEGECGHFKDKSQYAEVKHGEWDDNIIGFCNVCLECGAIVERTAIKNNSGKLNYCPNCGADMRGETNG
jgi:hypothetical protein